MIAAQRIQPSPWWYAASTIPFIVGVALGVVLIVTLVKDVASSLHHFNTPGQVTVQLDDGDRRDIFLQVGGAPNSTNITAADLACQVRGPGGPVSLDTADNVRLSTGGDVYRSRFTFEANADGAYTVRCRTAERRFGPPASVPLAVGPHIGVLQIVGTVFGVIAAFGGGIILGGAVIGLVAFLRHRSKVRLQREAAGGVAGSGYPPGGGLS
jgi:hypothetical protein